MRRKMNKGVSMVEILISIAIFAILMIPIVSGIISTLNNSTEAKNLQYRNEFAENMVEYVKQDSLVNVIDGKYFSSIGATDVTTSGAFYVDPAVGYDKSLDNIAQAFPSGTLDDNVTSDVFYTVGRDKTYYPYESYMTSGKVKLGTKKETYSYKMEISNKYYAEKESDPANGYINPNNLALGVVEDIDHTKVALINGTIANYDSTVSDAFLTKKMEILKTSNPDWYEIYTKQEEALVMFPGDTATRLITVKVSGKADKGYKVTCSLKYKDNSEWNASIRNALADYYISYVPFEYNYAVDSNTGVATLPNIYLMYNVCLYNGSYSADDYIAIDTEDLEDDVPVNLFIVETAETYSSNITAANTDRVSVNANNKINKLYNDNVAYGNSSRDEVSIHIGATIDSNLSNVSVYHNFDLGRVVSGDAGEEEEENRYYNTKNNKILYSESDGTFYKNYFTMTTYKPLEVYNAAGTEIDHDNSVAKFGALDEAQEESRGLYQIKVWMVKSDNLNDVDTSKPPILTGTKGGDES